MRVSNEVLHRFNGLLIPCFFTRELPSNVDLVGYWKFAQRFYENSDSLEGRRELLHLVLAQLHPNCLDNVYNALFRAQQDKMRAYLVGYRIDARRDFNNDRKKAMLGLENLRGFLKDC